ncbi:MAG: methyl-accepting chemotaxis protein [Patescibacteria group bacterium]|nr:methyl-accepting chemotaxis protein [Patescibacteria group bacterium]
MRISLKVFVSIIGALLFLASLVALYFAIDKEETAPLLLVALVNIIAVFTLLFLITRGILPSLSHIQDILREVGKGNFATRVDLDRPFPAELREVAKTVNIMVARIQRARGEVEKAKDGLEDTVEERTKELRELTETLEDRVEERTKELEEKIKELERFQHLSVGRELKMIELKKEIEELQQYLKKATV